MSILDGIKGKGQLQKEKEIAVKRSALEKRVDAIMLKYDVWLGEREFLVEDYYKNAYRRLKGIKINHQAIDEFCVRIRSYQDVEEFENGGCFLSAMIQNAYGHGYNDFHINTQHLEKNLGRIGAYMYCFTPFLRQQIVNYLNF